MSLRRAEATQNGHGHPHTNGKGMPYRCDVRVLGKASVARSEAIELKLMYLDSRVNASVEPAALRGYLRRFVGLLDAYVVL
jgi:hypothetical protein